MHRILTLFACLLLSQTATAETETQFIKYRNYLIPLTTEVVPDVACEFREIPADAEVQDEGNARVIILSDLAGEDNRGGFDPDDIQSLVHAVTYADKLDIEGVIPTATRRRDLSLSQASASNEAMANEASEDRFNDIVDAYASDLSRLRTISGDFPDAEVLRNNTFAGGAQFRYSINQTPLPVNDDTVSFKNDGVAHIIKRARCGWFNDDQRPLYVLSWGSSVDFAQAVASAPDIKRVVRFVSYSHVNDGDLGNGFTDSTCSIRGLLSDPETDRLQCQSWNFLRTQLDLWWVDYVGEPRPLQTCDGARLTAVEAGGNLGDEIIANGVEHGELTGFGGGFGEDCFGSTQSFLKIGDTITTAFVLNVASQRNNPSGTTRFGNHIRTNASLRPTYWVLTLTGNRYPGFDVLYTDWIKRANSLR